MISADVSGYVLAGGESSRMQRADLPPDKALLMLGGTTLLERALATLAQVCPDPRILCGNAERCARLRHLGPTVPDIFLLSGPLGGLHAALCDTRERAASWTLLVPVDLPWMPAEILRIFLEHALASSIGAACMQAEGVVQPLPALVRADAEPTVAAALHAGERKLLPILQQIARNYRKQAELCVLRVEDFGLGTSSRDWFRNVNTPHDFAAAQQDETLRGGVHQSKHGG